MTMPKEFHAYRVKDFLAHAGFSAAHFWKLVKDNRIHVIRIGGRVLIPHAEATRIFTEGVAPARKSKVAKSSIIHVTA